MEEHCPECEPYACSPGAIELKIFSEHYKVELDVVDIQTQRIDRFGKVVYLYLLD